MSLFIDDLASVWPPLGGGQEVVPLLESGLRDEVFRMSSQHDRQAGLQGQNPNISRHADFRRSLGTVYPMNLSLAPKPSGGSERRGEG
jgi:hypothetical protein